MSIVEHAQRIKKFAKRIKGRCCVQKKKKEEETNSFPDDGAERGDTKHRARTWVT